MRRILKCYFIPVHGQTSGCVGLNCWVLEYEVYKESVSVEVGVRVDSFCRVQSGSHGEHTRRGIVLQERVCVHECGRDVTTACLFLFVKRDFRFDLVLYILR